MSRTDFATSPGQEDGIGAGGLGALRLDILTSHSAHDSSFLVNLREEIR